MPVLETALLVKGAAALIKAGPVIWAKIAGYAAAHGVAATVSAVAGLAIVVGGIKWTQEKIESLQNLLKAFDDGDTKEIVKNAISVSGILGVADGIESIGETKDILEQVISEEGKNASVNLKAALRCGTLLSEVHNELKKAVDEKLDKSQSWPNSVVANKIRIIVSEQLEVAQSEVHLNSSFVDDLGADSLDTAELVMALEEEFEVEIPDTDAEQITTVGQAIQYVERHIG
ncbi:MAG: acyl carrier protein [Candidatus Accumulibacter sp.]|nr:acyl carrier protein [Accumulibacter sp.]